MLKEFVNVPCQEVGICVFFPTDEETDRYTPEEASQARRICHKCHMISECLEFAMQENFEYGIYGGMTPAERRALARYEKRRKLGGQPRKQVA